MRGGPEARAYAPHLQGKLLAIRFITVGEMYFGYRRQESLSAVLFNASMSFAIPARISESWKVGQEELTGSQEIGYTETWLFQLQSTCLPNEKGLGETRQ